MFGGVIAAMLPYLKNYQTLIGGLRGFGAVIITLIVNGWLARKMEKEKVRREADALRRALLEEMKVQREALITTAEEGNRVAAKGDRLVPILRFCAIFDSAVERLGLLELQEVASVLNAHLPLKLLTPKLQMIASRVPLDQRGVEHKEKPAEYVLIGQNDVELVGKMHRSYVAAFDKAINELGSRLR